MPSGRRLTSYFLYTGLQGTWYQCIPRLRNDGDTDEDILTVP